MLNKKRPLQVAEGVFQLQVPIPDNPLGYLLAYYLPGPQGDTLIDTGWNEAVAREALEEQIALVGGRLPDIRQVVVTHGHPDHSGLAEFVREASGAALLIHQRERQFLAERREGLPALRKRLDARLAKNCAPANSQLADSRHPTGIRDLIPGPADCWLSGDEELPAGQFSLRVIPTPGHTPGHICLYEPQQKLLFAGDHVLPGITPNVSLEAGAENPLAEYLASLAQLTELPVELVLPAHEHAFPDLPGRIDEIIAHHQERSAEIVGNLSMQGETAYHVAHKVTWTVGPFERLGAWDRRMAVLEVLSHLRWALLEGEVTVEQRGEVTYFRPVVLNSQLFGMHVK